MRVPYAQRLRARDLPETMIAKLREATELLVDPSVGVSQHLVKSAPHLQETQATGAVRHQIHNWRAPAKRAEPREMAIVC